MPEIGSGYDITINILCSIVYVNYNGLDYQKRLASADAGLQRRVDMWTFLFNDLVHFFVWHDFQVTVLFLFISTFYHFSVNKYYHHWSLAIRRKFELSSRPPPPILVHVQQRHYGPRNSDVCGRRAHSNTEHRRSGLTRHAAKSNGRLLLSGHTARPPRINHVDLSPRPSLPPCLSVSASYRQNVWGVLVAGIYSINQSLLRPDRKGITGHFGPLKTKDPGAAYP